jgi:hypothetical protein
MKNISKFASKLTATQVINKKGLATIKGGQGDPPPWGDQVTMTRHQSS